MTLMDTVLYSTFVRVFASFEWSTISNMRRIWYQ